MRLYGPGDIIGIDTRLIVRTDPKPFVTNFEPNYLALVEFDPPDFPWMFSPAQSDGSKRLRPWLVLLVLDRDRVPLPRLQPGAPLPSITIPSAHTATELPNLADAWMWAHAQAASALPATASAQLAAEMKADPRKQCLAPGRTAPARAEQGLVRVRGADLRHGARSRTRHRAHRRSERRAAAYPCLGLASRRRRNAARLLPLGILDGSRPAISRRWRGV